MANAALLGPPQELRGRGGRVPTAPIGLLDRVADLDCLGILDRLYARRPVIAGVADHHVVQDDGVGAPLPESRVLSHLPEAELEEAPPAPTREIAGRNLDSQELGRLFPPTLEQRLEELGRHRAELDQVQSWS